MPQVTYSPPDSKVLSVRELYEKSSPLIVPRWQRDYSWKPGDHFQKLIEDLSEFFERSETDPSRYYLLGQVIVVTNDVRQNEIVDGQQRLTTVYLMLLCLLNNFKISVNNNERNNSLIYSSLISSIVDEDDRLRLELPFQDGTRILQYLYDSNSDDRSALGEDLTRSQLNLLAIYDHFDGWVNEQLKDEKSLTTFAKRLMKDVYFTRLVIGDIPQALDYFEKMNRRGLPLDAANLLKNYLFSQVDQAKFDALTDSWRKMSNEVEKIKRRSIASTESFIKSWAVSRSFQKINGTEALLNYWKNELDSDAEREFFVREMLPMSKLYRNLAEGTYDKSNSKMLERTRNLGGSQHLSVLLAGSKLEKFLYFCDLVDRRFTLYTFANERTGAFESMIPKWCEKIAELPNKATENQILSASQAAEGFLHPGADGAITTFIRGLNYRKNSNHRKLRFVLALTARHLDIEAKAEHHDRELSFYLKTATKNKPGFDMDHVLGQKYLGGLTENQKIIFNSIGALTPLFSSTHRADTNLKPAEKSVMYEQSPFIITKSLSPVLDSSSGRIRRVLTELRDLAPVDLMDWNETSVESRTNLIIKTFLDEIIVKDFLKDNQANKSH